MLRNYISKIRTRRALAFLRQYDACALTTLLAPYVR